MLATYLMLARLRIRWYALATGRLLMRHWQWFVVAVVVMPMGAPLEVLLRALGYPLIAMFSSGHGLLWHLACIVAVQGVALVWIVPQRHHIAGGDFMRYVAALPIPAALRRGVDVTLLALANSILLAPVIVAIALASTALRTDGAYQVAALLVLLSTVIAAQWATLERIPAILPAILLADIPLGLSAGAPSRLGSWLLLVMACGSAMALLVFHGAFERFGIRVSRFLGSKRTVAGRRRLKWFPPALRTQFKALAEQPASTAIRASLIVALAVAADLLIRVFQFDARSLPTAILAMAAIALILSGVYRMLQAAHAPMRLYLAALSISPRYWPIRDILFVMLLGLVPLGILMLPLAVNALSPMLTLAALTLAYQALLALLRLPVVCGGRQAMLLGLILAGTWSGAAMAAIVR